MNVLTKLTALKIECSWSELRYIQASLPVGMLHRIPNDKVLIDPFAEKLFYYGQFDLVEFFVNHKDDSIDEFIFVEE